MVSAVQHLGEWMYAFGNNRSTNGPFKVTTGTYTFTVPDSYPIAFFGSPNISYTGTETAGNYTDPENISREFFYGTVTLTISGSFTSISYSYLQQWYGGQDNIEYDSNCT